MQKNFSRARLSQRLFLTNAAIAAAASVFGGSARAGVPVYWDPTNGTALGTGSATPGGSGVPWNTTDARWNPLADGTDTPVVWNNANADTAVFAAGTDATGSYTVTTAGTLSLAGITKEEGITVTLSPATTNWTLAGPGGTMLVDVASGLLVVNGRYTGSLITKTGAGIFNSGTQQTNTFAGKWAVTGGSLSFGADLRIGVVPAALQTDAITVSSGGKFRTGAATVITQIHALRGMTIGAGGGGFDTPIDATAGPLTTIWNGPITGSVGGDLQMSGDGTVVLMNTTNNYDGNTALSNNGFLQVGASGVIPDTSVVSQTGGTFDMATNVVNETVKSISGTGGTISLGAASTLTLANPAGETAAQTLKVQNGGKIIKNGTGALTLAGGIDNNNASIGFNGEFILNDGTLGVGTSTMLGGSNTPTATLTINGGRLSNSDGDAKNFNAALITNLSGDFTVGTNLFPTPGVIRFNGGTQTIRNSNRTITVNGLANLDLAGVVAEDVPGRSLTKEGTGILQLTNAANTYTGGTIVNAGTLLVARMHENNPVTINAGLLKVRESSPNLSSGFPAGDNAFVSRPSGLTIAAGATLDITNNDVILDYSGSSPLATYEALVASGYNLTGDWQGDGITSSVAALDGNYVVAIADNATLAAPFGTAQGGPLFAGVDVDLDTILIKFTHRADINLDGVITPDDSAIFGGNYDEGQPAVWATGDMNYDGVFTPDDAAIFGGAYDESLASLPEPASLAAVAIAGLGLARRRRR